MSTTGGAPELGRLYNLENSRNPAQLAEMTRLQKSGECLFCFDSLASDADHPLLWESESWVVTPNRYPYADSRLHLLLIPKKHAADIVDLEDAALQDFWEGLRWIHTHYSLSHYGLGVRCGDCRFTGGTIQHVHVHVLVGDVDAPGHRPIRLKLSSSVAVT